MNNYNARIQDLILEINETLAPRHFSRGHPEPEMFHRFRREVVDCAKRPMGCVQIELSERVMFGDDDRRSDMIITMDTNAHMTSDQGWINFHVHVVNFEMRTHGRVYFPLTCRVRDHDSELGKRMVGWLAGILDKLKE